MSAKWVRSKQWDDQHFPPWAWPAKAVLRAFSSIPLAIVLLTLLVLYSTLASVPVGLMALGVTYFIYFLTILLAIAFIGLLPVLILRRLWRTRSTARFITSLAAAVILSALAVELWVLFAWPALHYDPATGSGLRLFASFVEQYRSTTLRRLPGFEMSEPEFYSWWPLRLILALFILNMVTATVRRIEFSFPNIGVLTVHTGIVVIALGSMYYRGLKIEGDTLLLAGQPGPDGSPNVGPIQDRFYDNQSTALWLNQNGMLWDQRPIQPPRYNDYNLAAAGWPSARSIVSGLAKPDGRTFNQRVPNGIQQGERPVIDADLRFRIVGYAHYARPVKDWVRASPRPGSPANPMRFLDLRVAFPDRQDASSRTAFRFFFAPDSPIDRASDVGDALAIEYTRGMSDTRWRAINSPLPADARHAIEVAIPGSEPVVLPVTQGQTLTVNGYTIVVKELAPQPPFPIITKGYENADSSLAILTITPPPADGKPARSFERWVYHRFPEISQDMLDELNDRGMPKRRDADPSITITYVDASRLHIFLDERPDGTVRAALRQPSGQVRTLDGLNIGSTIEEVAPRTDPATNPKIDLVLGERWEHAEAVERPQVVPDSDREKSDVGTHTNAMLAVEVSSDAATWTRTVWIPFVRYHNAETDKHREITLPDGRQIRMAFGRLAHRFPGFFVQLTNFEMIAYDHRGAPRDYQSVVRVIPTSETGATFKPYEHITKLNAPLQAPFIWSSDRSWFANVAGTLTSRLNPNQFKFSQAGWDAEGWRQTQALTDRGQLQRPFASFTILGVGNNPGIHIIALGGILMSLGIPWAFYLKPLILQRRKLKIQQQLASGTYKRPESDVSRSPAPALQESQGVPS